MPRLNLLSPLSPSAQAAEADQGAIEIINAYADKLSGSPVIKTRPGLKVLDTFEDNARVDVYWWEAKRILILVCAGRVYYKLSLNAVPIEITPVSVGDRIAYNTKVMFSSDTYGITMTTGTHMLWWNSVTANCIRVTDAHAPSEITGITYLKGYLIASVNNSQNFAWATYGPTDDRSQPPVWSAYRLSASASPDDIICMSSGWEELFLLGRESVENQYVTGDSTVPFRSLQGSAGEVGIINNKCLIKLKNTWLFLTPSKQVVILNGREPNVISKPIEYILEAMENFEDVETLVLFERFCIFNFVTEDKTFVFDSEYHLWYRWEFWNTTYKKYTKYLGATATVAKAWGVQIVGSYRKHLYTSSYSDLTDGDSNIRGQILSAHIDHGILDRKFVNTIKLRLGRGY